jgi:hypothetical protein
MNSESGPAQRSPMSKSPPGQHGAQANRNCPVQRPRPEISHSQRWVVALQNRSENCPPQSARLQQWSSSSGMHSPPPQTRMPGPHPDGLHCPPTHVSPGSQSLPHPPQCSASVWVSTQSAPHLVPAAHPQLPSMQVNSPAHGWLQPPQCCSLSSGSTQRAPHWIWSPGHPPPWHEPSTQAMVFPQFRPQPPQWRASVCGLTQALPHLTAPFLHVLGFFFFFFLAAAFGTARLRSGPRASPASARTAPRRVQPNLPRPRANWSKR